MGATSSTYPGKHRGMLIPSPDERPAEERLPSLLKLPQRILVLLCIGCLLAGCGEDNPDVARGYVFLESLDNEVRKGRSEIPLAELIDGYPQTVCLMAPYSPFINPSSSVSKTVEAIARNVDVGDERLWGLLVIDDADAGKYRYFSFHRHQQNFWGAWSSSGAWLSECIPASDAQIAVNPTRQISLRKGGNE